MWGAAQGNRATHELNQAGGNRQAESAAFEMTAYAFVRLGELFEDALMMFRGDPDAAVDDGKADRQLARQQGVTAST